MVTAADAEGGDDTIAKRAEWLFRQECGFVAGAAEAARLPEPVLPEVAFVGRSNVGKSTLINALTYRKKLARTSNTPGRTQQINFFDLGGRLMLVDLPGYGYAKVSRSDTESWGRLIDVYLSDRPNLLRCFVLVDSRHGIKDTDRQMIGMLDRYHIPSQLILTKTDKATKAELAGTLAAAGDLTARSPYTLHEVYQASSVYTQPLARLREEMAALAGL